MTALYHYATDLYHYDIDLYHYDIAFPSQALQPAVNKQQLIWNHGNEGLSVLLL